MSHEDAGTDPGAGETLELRALCVLRWSWRWRLGRSWPAFPVQKGAPDVVNAHTARARSGRSQAAISSSAC